MASPEPRGPSPTVDIVIELEGRGIVLIERKYPPHGWAIPGGFVETGETLAQAARREAREETSLDVELTELFHVYSDPRRDPRRHTISTVFLARAHGEPRADDDAQGIGVFRQGELPPLCFDHSTILEDYFEYRSTGRRPPTER